MTIVGHTVQRPVDETNGLLLDSLDGKGSPSSEQKRRIAQKFSEVDSRSSKQNSLANGKQRTLEAGKKLRWLALRVMQFALAYILILTVIYFWPLDPQIEPKVATYKPRPKFAGGWALDERLDAAEMLFEGQFHAPESMAWSKDGRSFYTGVEGGFILRVEPYEERWTVAARLNGRRVRDLTAGSSFESANSKFSYEESNATERLVPFCSKDVELYGRRAEFEPKLVSLSRCSRPLGVRLSPDESYLYASDAFAGLYRVDLDGRRDAVSKLLDFSRYLHDVRTEPQEEREKREERVVFADDIAVDWAPAGQPGDDLIYLTDCSKRWSVRYLFWLMVENDDTGRVLQFDTRTRVLKPLELSAAELPDNAELDPRKLSFPNGVELSANKSALLIADLNNRRILMHHLRGPLENRTQHLLWAAGYVDNVRRGIDLPDGRPSYWAGCGCAVEDGEFELAEFFNTRPIMRRIGLKTAHVLGASVEQLGRWLQSTWLLDSGMLIKAVWFKRDFFCSHGVVFQFAEDGELMQSLHAPHFSSNFKIISEAHQVALNETTDQPSGNRSALYLGSVYYSYLGRLELGPD